MNNSKRKTGSRWLAALVVLAMLTSMLSAIALAEELEEPAPVEVVYELPSDDEPEETHPVETPEEEPVDGEPTEEKEEKPEQEGEPKEEEAQEQAEEEKAPETDAGEKEETPDEAEGAGETEPAENTEAEGLEPEEKLVPGGPVAIYEFVFDESEWGGKVFDSKREMESYIAMLPDTLTAILSDGSEVSVSVKKWHCAYEFKEFGEFRVFAELDDTEYELTASLPELTLFVNTDFNVETTGGTARIVGWNGHSDRLVVPDHFGGYPVTEIGEGAFEGHKELMDIELPDTLEAIESNAFAGCSNLIFAKLPDSLTDVAPNAFVDAEDLTFTLVVKGHTTLEEPDRFDEVSLPKDIGSLEVYGSLTVNTYFTVEDGNTYNYIDVKKGGRLILNAGSRIINKSSITVKGTFENNGEVYGCYPGSKLNGEIEGYNDEHTDDDDNGVCEICGTTIKTKTIALTAEFTGDADKLIKTYDGTAYADLSKGDFELVDADEGKVWIERVTSIYMDDADGSHDISNGTSDAGKHPIAVRFVLDQDDASNHYSIEDILLSGEIEPANLSDAEVDPIPVQEHSDTYPSLTVRYGGIVLKEGADGDYIVVEQSGSSSTERTLVLRGCNNFTGYLEVSYEVKPPKTQKKLTLKYKGKGTTKVYDGTKLAALNIGDFELKGVAKGDTVEIAALEGTYDTADVGSKHSVTVSATLSQSSETYDYVVDEIVITGKITERDIAEASLGDIGSYNETGEPIEPGVTLTFEGRPLVEDRDYSISSYENNVEPGTATVTIRGRGNFNGERTATFTIIETVPYKTVTVTLNSSISPDKVYDGTDKARLKVSDFNPPNVDDEDFNNVSIASINAYYDGADVGSHKLNVEFELKGSAAHKYEFVFAEVDCKITPRTVYIIPVKDEKIYGTSDPDYYQKGLIEGDEELLTGDLSHILGSNVDKTEDEDDEDEDEDAEDEDLEDVGEYIFDVSDIDAGENYVVQLATDYEKLTIKEKNITDEDVFVHFDKDEYKTTDGTAVTPTITIDYIKRLEEGEEADYTVVFSNNTKRGTGIATITGVGNYTGTRVEKFTIKRDSSGSSGGSSSGSSSSSSSSSSSIVDDDDYEDLEEETVDVGQLVLGEGDDRVDVGYILFSDNNEHRPFKNSDDPDLETIWPEPTEPGELIGPDDQTEAPEEIDESTLPKRLTIEPEPLNQGMDENDEPIPRLLLSDPDRYMYEEKLHLRLDEEQVDKLRVYNISELVYRLEDTAELRVPLDELTFEVDLDRYNNGGEEAEEESENWGDGEESETSDELEPEVKPVNTVPVALYELTIEQLETGNNGNMSARELNALKGLTNTLRPYRFNMIATNPKDEAEEDALEDPEALQQTIEDKPEEYRMLGYLKKVEVRVNADEMQFPEGLTEPDTDELPNATQTLYVSDDNDNNMSDEDATVLSDAVYVEDTNANYALFNIGNGGMYTIVLRDDWKGDEEAEVEEAEESDGDEDFDVDEDFDGDEEEEADDGDEEFEDVNEPEKEEPEQVEPEPEPTPEPFVDDPEAMYAYSRKSNAGNQYWLIDTKAKTVEYYRGDTDAYVIGDYTGSLMSGMDVTFRTTPPVSTTIQLKFKQTYKFAMMEEDGASLLMEQDDVATIQSTMSGLRK